LSSSIEVTLLSIMGNGVYVHTSLKRNRFLQFLSLLTALVRRDIAGKYRRSYLGVWWAFLQPLILMVLFTMLRGFVNIPSEGIPYVLFSYSALVPWTFFTNAISSCGPSIVDNAEVIKKIALQREVFPLAGVTTALFDLVMSGIVLAGMMVWFRVPVGPSLLWLPVLILLTAAVAFGIGMLLAGLGTFRRDFIFAVPFITQAWLFATPVIYPLSSVPERWKHLYMLNPMVGIIEGFRNVLVKGVSPHSTALGISVIVAVLLLIICWPVFRRLSGYFADVL
jgi:homopolymeric O-antigen transport system permease protein